MKACVKITPDLIAAIHAARGTEPEAVAAALQEIQAIVDARASLVGAEEQASRRAEKERAALRTRWQALQAACPHWSRTYHGDPAGGFDSHMVCDFCGKEGR